MKDWTLLIMAAGGSTRYGRLKQTDPLGPNGESLIDYSTYDAVRNGCQKVVFVVRHEMEDAFRDAVGRRIESQVEVDYVFQDDVRPVAARAKPWGTAHAVLAAAHAIKEPFAVINADDYYGRAPFRALAEHFDSDSQSAVLVGFHLRDTLSDFGPVKRGLCAVAGEMLESVEEVDRVEERSNAIEYTSFDGVRHFLTGDEVVSMNVWGFEPGILADLQELWVEFARKHQKDETVEFFIPNVVGRLIAEGRLSCRVVTASNPWFGITYPEDRPIAIGKIHELVRQGVYPKELWN